MVGILLVAFATACCVSNGCSSDHHLSELPAVYIPVKKYYKHWNPEAVDVEQALAIIHDMRGVELASLGDYKYECAEYASWGSSTMYYAGVLSYLRDSEVLDTDFLRETLTEVLCHGDLSVAVAKMIYARAELNESLQRILLASASLPIREYMASNPKTLKTVWNTIADKTSAMENDVEWIYDITKALMRHPERDLRRLLKVRSYAAWEMLLRDEDVDSEVLEAVATKTACAHNEYWAYRNAKNICEHRAVTPSVVSILAQSPYYSIRKLANQASGR